MSRASVNKVLTLLSPRSSRPHLLLRLRHHHCLLRPPPHPRSSAAPRFRHLRPVLLPVRCSPQHHHLHVQAQFASVESLPRYGQRWREWSSLLESLSAAGYFNTPADFDAQNEVVADFPEEMLSPASACLAFAGDRPNLLGMLSQRDIEVVVQNMTPFLFKDVEGSVRRMRFYLSSGVSNVLDADKANTVDLMKFLLSYVGSFAGSEANNLNNRELVESSVRNLLSELAKLRYGIPDLNLSRPAQNQFPDTYGTTQRTFGPKVEMKRGDWICPRCNFMNFARNVKCLECEEARPKRQLTGGEWECPQCDFFNYGKNTVCLRCECKRPGDISLGSINIRSGSGLSIVNSTNNVDLEKKLAANEEKGQRWFSKVSQLNSSSEVSSAVADEDFPEIIPLRKGVNRFVVSTRKTPLERRLANNAQYQRDSSDGSTLGNQTLRTKISKSLDEILRHSSAASESDYNIATSGQNPMRNLESDHTATSKPFVALPNDYFGKKSEHQSDGAGSSSKSAWETSNFVKPGDARNQQINAGSWNSGSPGQTRNGNRTADYPLPFRDSSQQMTSQQTATESWNFRLSAENVVPIQNSFDPRTSGSRSWSNGYPDNENPNGRQIVANRSQYSFNPQSSGNQVSGNRSWSNLYSGDQYASIPDNVGQNVGNSWKDSSNLQTSSNRDWSPGHSENGSTNRNLVGNSPRSSVTLNGSSLEGSAVQEPDPLDMSEEAKAERWFKRVAQIKDISELSQIPDEDFPSIMPMRKGVNRFVVSKRKTPLERRLASQHHPRNLPAVSSEPTKNEDDGS